MPIGDQNEDISFTLTNYLRTNGFKVDVCLEHKSIGQMFKKAERRNAKYGIIIGDDEAKGKMVNLKNLNTQEQISVKFDDLLDKLDELLEDADEHHHEE